MGKVKISYVDFDNNILFNEKREYLELPTTGTFIIWHYCEWRVHKILENWDLKTITITFELIKKPEYKSKKK